MITLNHTINLVTEIDENKIPDHLLTAILNISEVQMEMLLRQSFISAMETEGFLEAINKDNSWATVKVAK